MSIVIFSTFLVIVILAAHKKCVEMVENPYDIIITRLNDMTVVAYYVIKLSMETFWFMRFAQLIHGISDISETSECRNLREVQYLQV